MDTALLHYIYLFDGVALPSSQSEGVCCDLAKLVASFAEKMVSEKSYQTKDHTKQKLRFS